MENVGGEIVLPVQQPWRSGRYDIQHERESKFVVVRQYPVAASEEVLVAEAAIRILHQGVEREDVHGGLPHCFGDGLIDRPRSLQRLTGGSRNSSPRSFACKPHF